MQKHSRVFRRLIRFCERQSAPMAAVCSFRSVGRGTNHVSQAKLTEVPRAPSNMFLPSQGTGASLHSLIALCIFWIFAWSQGGQVVHWLKCSVGPSIRKVLLLESPVGTSSMSCGSAEAALLLGQFSLELVARSKAAVASQSASISFFRALSCACVSRVEKFRFLWRNVRVRSSTYAVAQKRGAFKGCRRAMSR